MRFHIFKKARTVSLASKKTPKRLRDIDPLWALLPVIGFIGITLGVERFVNERTLALRETRSVYENAIVETKAQLENLLSKVAADKILFTNINWQLSYSANSALGAKLKKGRLDQLQLFDEKCAPIGKSVIGRAAPALAEECPTKAGSPLKLDQFYWNTFAGAPTLWLASKTTGVGGKGNSGNVIMVGMVHLDQDWLAHYSTLKKKIEAMDLLLGSSDEIPGALIVNEGPESVKASTRFFASLGTKASLDRFLPTIDREDGQKPYKARFLVLALLFAAFLTLTGLWNRQNERRRVAADAAALCRWSEELVPSPQFTMPGRKAVSHPNGDKTVLETVKYHVTKALQAKAALGRQIKQEQEESEALQLSKDEEIRRLRVRLAELAELDSLAQQIKRTTGEFLKRLSALHTKSEAVADRLEEKIAEPAKTLATMLADWKKGVRERGARKFIRGLAETPAHPDKDRPDDQSQLDVQLSYIMQLANELGEQALAITLDTQSLGETAAFATQVVGHWHGLAMRTGELQSPCARLLEPINDAQRLVLMEDAYRQITFKNLLSAKDSEQIPAVPLTIWTTALYHVYLSMADLVSLWCETEFRTRDVSLAKRGISTYQELSAEILPRFARQDTSLARKRQRLASGHQGTVVASRMRKDQQRWLLVVSITGENEDVLPKRGDKQSHHLDIARSLLMPFSINVAVLPSLSGPFPIVLSWDLNKASPPKDLSRRPTRNSLVSGPLPAQPLPPNSPV